MSKLEAAEQWLTEYLKDGAVASRTIKADGLRAGHAERTLKRAAESMGLRIISTSTVPRQTLWSLRRRTTGRTTGPVKAPNPSI